MLSSEDFGDSQDRVCTIISRPKGQIAGSSYLLVNIAPALESTFWDEPKRVFKQLILSVVGGRTLDTSGSEAVVVEIVLCPSYSGGQVDERTCSRIGTGSIRYIDSKYYRQGQM